MDPRSENIRHEPRSWLILPCRLTRLKLFFTPSADNIDPRIRFDEIDDRLGEITDGAGLGYSDEKVLSLCIMNVY